ncbi:MAG: Lrp/AsnC family transcriptional regulator [Proteobacteria bacterium]|nr:Lrp/AsnC family transcriptional regulator [Pseudomonadota bacterium]
MARGLDQLDRQLIEMLRVNARLPLAKMAKALDVSRTTVQARLKQLEAGGVITGYTISAVTAPPGAKLQAMVLVSIESRTEIDVVKALSKRHEIVQIYSISGKYDLYALLATETAEELDRSIDRIRAVPGVLDTFSTIILSTKLKRPE